MNWACLECSSPARLFHLSGWLVPISRRIPNHNNIKIIWNIPLQLKILLTSARFAYNDGTPPIGKAGGGDRWPSNRSQFGNWTCKINLWVDSVELNRWYTMNSKILEKIKCIMEGDIPPNANAPVRVSHTHYQQMRVAMGISFALNTCIGKNYCCIRWQEWFFMSFRPYQLKRFFAIYPYMLYHYLKFS